MKLPKELTTITKTSKILAAILFIVLPFLGFFAGMNYQQALNSASQISSTEPIFIKRVPTPTPSQTLSTSTWNQFQYSLFSLKLPLGWKETMKQDPIQFENYDASLPGRGFDPSLDKGHLKLEIYTTKNSFIGEYTERNQKGNIVTEIIVDGKKATKVKFPNTPGFVVYVKHPSKPIFLSIDFGLDFDNQTQLANQVLQTFKFLP